MQKQGKNMYILYNVYIFNTREEIKREKEEERDRERERERERERNYQITMMICMKISLLKKREKAIVRER